MNSPQILSAFSEYAEKYTQRVSHNLHTFVQVVLEVVVFLKFTRKWGIELVSLNKNPKIPENSSYFRDAFRTQLSMTGKFAKIVNG